MEDQGAREGEWRGRPEDEAEMARLQEEISNMPVSEHLVYMVHSLSALAVARLGLTADTSAKRDLDQARLAIDALKALVGVLEPARPTGEMAALRGMLSQLQLAYVSALGAPAPAAQAAPGEERPAESQGQAATRPSAPTVEAPAKKAPAARKKPPAGQKATGEAGKRAPAAAKKAPASSKGDRSGS